MTRNATNQTFLSKKRWTNDFSVGTGLVFDEMRSKLLNRKTCIITYFAERRSRFVGGGGGISAITCVVTHSIYILLMDLTELEVKI